MPTYSVDDLTWGFIWWLRSQGLFCDPTNYNRFRIYNGEIYPVGYITVGEVDLIHPSRRVTFERTNALPDQKYYHYELEDPLLLDKLLYMARGK